jgi:hypothetical protein
MMHCCHLLFLKHKEESYDNNCHCLLHCNTTKEEDDNAVLSSSS